MKKFEVKLRGENFIFSIDGEHRKFSFDATRFILAKDKQEAEKIAVIMVHKSPSIKDAVINEGPDRPRINFVETREVNALKFFFKKSENRFEFHSEENE